jgi:hypothetical protein
MTDHCAVVFTFLRQNFMDTFTAKSCTSINVNNILEESTSNMTCNAKTALENNILVVIVVLTN